MGGAGDAAVAAVAVVLSSNGGKGKFNLREKFLDFDVLTCGGPSNMVKCPLDNIITVCCCSRQVVEMGVKIICQVCALGENTGFLIRMGQVWSQVRCCGQVGWRLSLLMNPLTLLDVSCA